MNKPKSPSKLKLWWDIWFPRIVFVSLLLSVIFTVVNIITANPGANPDIPYDKVKSDYVLMLLQCTFGLIVMFMPGMLEKKLKIVIPHNMYLLFIVFLYAAIYLGEVRSFYYRIPNWDTILHTFSGGMLGTLGFSIVHLLNGDKKVNIKLSPFFVALFAFTFAVTLGAIWEVYEFTFDGLLGLNMQKFQLEDGTMLIGRAALADTMKDIIVDILGALTASIIGYISLKYKKGWIETLEVRRSDEDEIPEVNKKSYKSGKK